MAKKTQAKLKQMRGLAHRIDTEQEAVMQNESLLERLKEEYDDLCYDMQICDRLTCESTATRYQACTEHQPYADED